MRIREEEAIGVVVLAWPALLGLAIVVLWAVLR
jgi:hypothetical protein